MKRVCLLLITLAISILVSGGCAGSNKASVAEPRSFTILTYNTLYGFNHGKKIDDGAKWIAEQNPDVVALEELNGFTQETLERTAKTWGHHHARILKEDGFPVGITSKEPMETLEARVEGMHHGFLHCRASGIHFFVIHLSPHSLEVRRREAEILCGKIESLLERGESVVALGDFNAMSPLDREDLDRADSLLNRMIESERKNAHIRNLDNGRFDYSVVQRLLDAGLEDPCPGRVDRAFPSRGIGSFPSQIGGKTSDQQEKENRRIDFVLLSPDLARRCLAAAIPRDAVLDQVSDHYPVVVTLGGTEE